MKELLTLLCIGILFSCTSENKKTAMTYPETTKKEVVDNYFGVEVSDPYRWLEDDNSEETKDWVGRQNEVTFSYLENIPFRKQIQDKLTELWDYEKYSSPFKIADKYYYYKNDGLQNQSVLYVAASLEDEGEVFLDPNSFSADGTVSLAGISFTEDGSLMAYSISESGSDWRKAIVMNTETKELVGDTLKDLKFTGLSWKGSDGFFYSSYDKPEPGEELSGINFMHKIYYHKIGTPQSEDKLILGGESFPRRYMGASVSEDDKYLFISASNGTSGNELYLMNLEDSNPKLVTIVDDMDSDQYVTFSDNDLLYIYTNREAPNGKVATASAQNPSSSNWKTLIAEKEHVLNGASFVGGKMFLNYMEDVSTHMYEHEIDGTLVREIKLPAIGRAGGFGGKMEDNTTFFTFTSFTYPTTIYKYDVPSGEYEVFRTSNVKFNPDDFVTRQIFYKSKDGTEIPMFIVHKKGIEMDGSNPTLLYGYGGFNISLQPSFSISRLAWMEMGGVYALANLRGGGEYGEEWHVAGTKMNKQNVFDDFIAAAEYLQNKKYTSPEKLVIEGGSNGGLLVGACMTQRPDLFAVALPAVGVMDMLRFHKFTAGAGWITDYGCADSSKEMFEYIRSYSPVHNVKSGVSYPATMVTTADHDDRVVPAHSFKFAAQLQDKHAGETPVLIRIETKAGHGAGKPTEKVIEELTDKYAFTLYNMGEMPFKEEM